MIDGDQSELLVRSVFGLIGSYNSLPSDIALCDDLKKFKAQVLDVVKDACANKVDGWNTSVKFSLDYYWRANG